MNFNRIFIVALLLLLTINWGFSQQYFTKQQLWEDADSWYYTTYDVHPDMFAFVSKEEFDKEFANMKESLSDSMTIVEFYREFTPLVADLKEGHTSLHCPDLREYGSILLPLKLEINQKDYSLTVVNDLADEENAIPKGSTLISINGHDSKDIVRSLMKYVSGEKEHYRMAILQSGHTLSQLFYIIYGETVFDISYIYNGNEHSKNIDGITTESYDEKMRMFTNQINSERYTFSINEDLNTAIIEFNSLSDFEEFSRFLQLSFTEIKEKNISNLIIDIRNNGGGDSTLGDEFFQYISSKPFQQYGEVHIKMSKTLKEMYQDDMEVGVYKFNEDPLLIELRDNPLRYQGDTYLLTSNVTFSSAANFSWAFQQFGMGKIVGEETGGLAVCFGDILSFKLFNTKLDYIVSFKKFYGYGATDENIHGTLPDYEVPAEEAMEYVINMIKEKGLK